MLYSGVMWASVHALSLCVGAVKVVDYHPPRLLLICLFPPVPRDHDLVAITLVNPPPATGDYSCVSCSRLWVDPSSADCI